jgi:hypothetical protein
MADRSEPELVPEGAEEVSKDKIVHRESIQW